MARRIALAVAVVLPLLLLVPEVDAGAARAPSKFVWACPVSTSPSRAECFALVRSGTGGRSAASPFNTPTGYGPGKLHTAYGLPTTLSGNQTIAIVDAFDAPNIVSDLADYSTFYGIPLLPTCTAIVTTSCFSVLNQNGQASPLPAPDYGWAVEISLDVEIAHGICQNCKILLIEANNGKLANLGTAVNTAVAKGADVVSNSYGSYGGRCAAKGYNHKNVAVVVAAGDRGFRIACPASLSTVVSVGGTTLSLASDGTYISESAWSGTGSGCSSSSMAKVWQSALSNWAATGCGTHRAMNDVSAVADPATGVSVYDTYFSFGLDWQTVGGTSVSAPLIAATYALAGNASSWAYPAKSLYDGTSALRDVTSGSNGTCLAHPLRCNAGAGYDLPTGLGTPHGLGAF
jgi:subtilase family serine protease